MFSDLVVVLVSSLYFILPAYLANAAPVFAKKINFLNIPVDFNKKIGNKPLFGSHKTWRGIFSATLTGGLVFYLQKLFYNKGIFNKISMLNYSEHSILFGFVMGFGAIFGDLIKSFFKRRVGIKPGGKFIPFDQIDFVIGGLVFSSLFFYTPPLVVWVVLIAVSVPIHITARYIGYLLNICDKW